MQLAKELIDAMVKVVDQRTEGRRGKDNTAVLNSVIASAVSKKYLDPSDAEAARVLVLDGLLANTFERINTNHARSVVHYSGHHRGSIGERQQPRRDRQDAD